jgi:hypothetical protein
MLCNCIHIPRLMRDEVSTSQSAINERDSDKEK